MEWRNFSLSVSKESGEALGRNMMSGAIEQVGKVLFLAIIFIVVAGTILRVFGIPARDSTDSPTERSGFKLRTDYGTGCQYLESRDGFLSPRLDKTGKQVCLPPSPGGE
jgi:hypothetical protein